MATKKAFIDSAWESNDKKYPTKRGNCDFCGMRDNLKLSFDGIRYICVNDSACHLRWRKQQKDMGNG